MALRVAINGFGRIGRNFMRCWLSRGGNTDLEIVGLNGSGDTSTNAHLLKYDSMLGPLRGVDVTYTDNSISVNGKEIKVFYDRNPANLPWKDWGVDLVIESTGVFNDDVGASKHFEAGAKKVILTAPGKGERVGTFVVGVNADQYRHEDWDILSNASCTTNCMAPLVKVLDQNFGIVKGTMTTTHSYTGDQRILDASHRDLRRRGQHRAHQHRRSQGGGSGVSAGEGQAQRHRPAGAHPQRVGGGPGAGNQPGHHQGGGEQRAQGLC
jgi:glyceraldehyde-3-phosphate dehydrogenase (NAD(P))